MAIFENTVRMDISGGFIGGGGIRPVGSHHWSEVTVFVAFRKYPWLLNLVLLLLAGYVIQGIYSRDGAPVKVLSASVSPTVVPAGGDVQIKYVVNRYQICPNTISSRWENEANDPTPIILPVRSRVVPQTGENLPVFLNLQAPTQLGKQCYRSEVVHHCPTGTFVVKAPQVCILVVPHE